jgi:type IV pilus assembly protein PilC
MQNNDNIIELGEADLVPIAGQLCQTIQAGLPLESGLRVLAEQTRSWKTRRKLLELSQNLEQGMPLVEAINASRAGLPRQMQVLVQAGIESGRLDGIMRYCIEQLNRASSLRQSIWLALSYPIFLIWFSTLICGGILVVIVPSFRRIFDDFGTELPTITVGLLEMSSMLSFIGWQPWLLLMFAGMGFYLLIIGCGLTKWGQRVMTSFPIVGRVFLYAALSDFCVILAALAESGLSVTKALQFAGESSDDPWVRRQSRVLVNEIDTGTPASSAAKTAGLPNSLCQVLRETSSEATFAQALRGLSDIYAAQCNVASSLANTVIAQFTVAFVVGFAGFVAIALFMPLIKLLNDLS